MPDTPKTVAGFFSRGAAAQAATDDIIAAACRAQGYLVVPEATPAYTDEIAAWAGAEALLSAGAALLMRCRVAGERTYLRDTLTEAAELALHAWYDYEGSEPPDDLSVHVARMLAKAEGRAG